MQLHLVRDPQTNLALDMNGAPLPLEHGEAIEFVADPGDIGMGMGGWREDQQFYANAAGI